MSESLFSASWYRVAGLKPRLRSHAQIHRHLYRGQVWYVLQDHSSGRFHRFPPVSHLLIGLMDGKRTLQEIWELACRRLGDDMPTQDEIIQLLSALHRADVLQADVPPDLSEQGKRTEQQRRMRLRQYLLNPLGLRFPLLDPDRLLERVLPFVRPLSGWIGALIWLATVGSAVVLAGMHWHELTEGMLDRILAAENLVLIWLVFPVVKALHEFGHALAVKAGGGEVHEMGVMLLVLVPVPYVDASSASSFRDKRRRMLVGAAGMLVELFIAAVAMLVWVNVEPGTLRAVAYNVILVAGVTTIFFNANPLLRFDGYYILGDYLEIPNLGQRANEYLTYLVNRYGFGVQAMKSPVSAPGEAGWFVGFGIASFCYRMFMLVSIVVLVASQYLVVGVILALWSSYAMFIQPLAKKISYLAVSPRLKGRRSRALVVTMATMGLLLWLLFWVPAPSWTRTEGVIWAPEDAVVRASTDGFIREVVAAPNQKVRAGDPLIVCTDPEIGARTRVLQAQLRELEVRHSAVMKDRVQSIILEEEIAHVRARLQRSRERVGELTVRSPGDGVFVIVAPEDAIGRLVQRGEQLAYVMDFSAVTVRVVVPQADVDLVAKATRAVELRAVERIADVVTATIKKAVPAATNELPSLALSLEGGGAISLDPTKSQDPAKSGEARSASSLFVFDLELATTERVWTLGNRVHVRFEHEPEPFGSQVYRSARRMFLNKFNI